MIRLVIAAGCTAALALGQGSAADVLVALEQNVQKTTSAWRILARDLDPRIARMLPCDPRAKAAIDDVTRASQARLVAMGEYYETAEAIASTRAEGAKLLLQTERQRFTSAASEPVEAAEALAGVEKQAADLAESLKQQPALGTAEAALRQTVDTARQRVTLAREQESRRDAVLAALTQLAAAYEARDKGLKDTLKALETERTRWNGYYAARLARSQTECMITDPTSSAPPAPARTSNTGKSATKGKGK